MSTKTAVHYGPRLLASQTGRLRAAVLVRPGPSIEQAARVAGEPAPIYTRALEAHDVLVRTLGYFGVDCALLEPRSDDPYEVAAADAAVAFEDGAVLMRPSAMARRGEADRMRIEFARIDVPLAGHIAAPGLLDGSDVLLVGETAFVGTGARGNGIGRSGFAQVAKSHGYRVVEVELSDDVTSLRSVASAVARDTVVLAPAKVDVAAFEGFKTIFVDCGEELAAGVLTLGEHHVLADIRYRTSLQVMRKAGVLVDAIDLYEFTKIGLTPSMLAIALKRD